MYHIYGEYKTIRRERVMADNNSINWANESVFYQIYPIGFCGAPRENDGVLERRILKVVDWIPHLMRLGCNAVYFSPVFESDKHGYDTRDYQKIDVRLGTNEDFANVCAALHEAGIRVVLDGVFNHVGRGFWAFQDVLEKREQSRYKDWFFINFGGNDAYGDNLWYEGWEGHYDLVKLNLHNPEVVQHLFESIRLWTEQFDIDGLRLDVAYLLDEGFLRQLRSFCDSLKPDFLLLGEILGGDYKRIVNPDMLESCTNYECQKGLYSSFNDLNLFEINYSLNRQFGEGGIYQNTHLLSFADNHDVTRVATILKDKRHLPALYGILFGMPGIPCVYYGSEWGAIGDKHDGDDALRMSYPEPEWNELTALISRLAELHRKQKALQYGGYRQVFLTNRQLVFERACDGEKIWVAVNADECDFDVPLNGGAAQELLTGESADLSGTMKLPAFSLSYWKLGIPLDVTTPLPNEESLEASFDAETPTY